MTKATITFTMQQALDFITEKLQDDFSSDFKFSVEISDNSCVIPTESQKSSSNPEAVSDNPWLIPDKYGWFLHDPDYVSVDCPQYIEATRKVEIITSKQLDRNVSYPACSWNWSNRDSVRIIKWKYAE